VSHVINETRYVSPELTDRVERAIGREFGDVDSSSQTFPFGFTDYYQDEMGKELERKFLSRGALVGPGKIADIKLKTNRLEEELADEVGSGVSRPVNIDPGYIGLSKLVLATTKNYSHRIYLKSGIYAEITLQFKQDTFIPLPWTYPDYRSDEYIEYFSRVRKEYKRQLDNIEV